MKRMQSKKSHSWWWDSHISRKNSRWLAENLENMDQSVKQMLRLIEEEGESFAKKAEMYYQKRPELISHVEDFYRMYRALAERYDQVTGDLRKNVQAELKSQVSGNGSDLISDPPSPSSAHSSELTPESKPQQLKPNSRVAGFDFFLGSGGSSDLSRKGSDGTYSSSLESDSEPEFDDADELNDDGISSGLQQRVHELEDELREVREKLKRQEEKSYHDQCSSKIVALEEENSAANEKLHTSETEIMELKKTLEDTNVSLEKKKIELNLEKEKLSGLEELIVKLQIELLGFKNESKVLKEEAETTAKQFEIELLNRATKIEECKIELIDAREKFGQEKSSLEAGIANLEGVNLGLKAEVEKLLQENFLLEVCISELEYVIKEMKVSITDSTDKIFREKSTLETEVLTLSQSNAFLDAKVNMLNDQMRQLEADRTQECDERAKYNNELNQTLDSLNVKVGMLAAEKEELASNVDSLVNDIKCRNHQVFQMNQNLHQLHLEHAKLIVEIEETRRASSDLKSRMKELEEEVDRQKVVISDGAEGKREAIRQLCFSLEHYRDGYHQLRQVLRGYERSAIVAN